MNNSVIPELPVTYRFPKNIIFWCSVSYVVILMQSIKFIYEWATNPDSNYTSTHAIALSLLLLVLLAMIVCLRRIKTTISHEAIEKGRQRVKWNEIRDIKYINPQGNEFGSVAIYLKDPKHFIDALSLRHRDSAMQMMKEHDTPFIIHSYGRADNKVLAEWMNHYLEQKQAD